MFTHKTWPVEKKNRVVSKFWVFRFLIEAKRWQLNLSGIGFLHKCTTSCILLGGLARLFLSTKMSNNWNFSRGRAIAIANSNSPMQLFTHSVASIYSFFSRWNHFSNKSIKSLPSILNALCKVTHFSLTPLCQQQKLRTSSASMSEKWEKMSLALKWEYVQQSVCTLSFNVSLSLDFG